MQQWWYRVAFSLDLFIEADNLFTSLSICLWLWLIWNSIQKWFSIIRIIRKLLLFSFSKNIGWGYGNCWSYFQCYFFSWFFIPFVFQHFCFPKIPIIIHTVVSVQLFFQKFQLFPQRLLTDGDFMSLEKIYYILIKQNCSNRCRCRLLKSVCWSKDDAWPKNVLLAALPVSKPVYV